MQQHWRILMHQNRPRISEQGWPHRSRIRKIPTQHPIRRANGVAADMRARLELLDRRAFGIAVQDAQELVFREFGSDHIAIAGR
ncbi:hypothetical protein W911_06075 [Hyphomicrobium nitrativorans NL23]|uniref:Uncharacterized protein n=1 Tax=Hyphomicrobium nitrativorans NL23 TaxID=1029756 RepID=V5SHP5_9HYPH|nr:hypothetical protein W911_06075 [Hyphomicrobium nitrativorans NL23]